MCSWLSFFGGNGGSLRPPCVLAIPSNGGGAGAVVDVPYTLTFSSNRSFMTLRNSFQSELTCMVSEQLYTECNGVPLEVVGGGNVLEQRGHGCSDHGGGSSAWHGQ